MKVLLIWDGCGEFMAVYGFDTDSADPREVHAATTALAAHGEYGNMVGDNHNAEELSEVLNDRWKLNHSTTLDIRGYDQLVIAGWIP